MKRISLVIAAASILGFALAPAAWAMSWKDVASLHQDGVADSLVIQKIIYSGQVFQLEAKDIRDLKKAGVSDEVISVMLRTEAQDQGDQGGDQANGDYHGDSYSHVTVGLGFGYYGGYGPYYGYGAYPYYGSYYGSYYPYYRSYYYPRYYPRQYGYHPYARPGYNYGNSRQRTNVNYGAPRSRTNYYSRPSYARPGYAHPAPGGATARHR